MQKRAPEAFYKDHDHFYLNITCPHCFRDVGLNQRGGVRLDAARSASFYVCDSCGHAIAVEIGYLPDHQDKGIRVLEIYPRDKTDDSVAPEITSACAAAATDLSEAKRCLGVSAFKATVAMCRRALQACVEGLGSTKGKRLVEQIDEAATRGIITKSLQDAAHDIRIIGNSGAHPSENLDEVTETDALDILEFARQIFEHVYVMPAKLAERKAARASKAP